MACPLPVARFIAVAPYLPHDTTDGGHTGLTPEKQALLNAAENWIRRHA